MTNAKPNELNYDHYATEKYDNDIINSIPGHKEMHKEIKRIIREWKIHNQEKKVKITELGIGTGLTAKVIVQELPTAKYTAIDFSKQMIQGAQKRLVENNVDFIIGDYAKIELHYDQDILVSVIGIHHQETDNEKKSLFKKIYTSLKIDGIFILGDLMTYNDKAEAALQNAYHYHHLVKHATDKVTLKEWAHHHAYLNKPASIEDQIQWLQEIGFVKISICFKKYNTILLIAQKK